MNQAEPEDYRRQIGRGPSQVAIESIEVFETLITNAQGDERINEVVVGGDTVNSGEHQSDAVSQGEGGDIFDDFPEIGQKEDDSEDEEQVIIAGQHVGGTQHQIAHIPPASMACLSPSVMP